MRSGLLAGVLLLAACGQQAEKAKPAEPAPAAPPSLAQATKSVAYTCEKDLPITAIYGTDAAGNPDVALIIRGQDFRLTPAVAASGARYTSQAGLEPGLGLAWWEKGDEAMLQQAPSAQIDDPAVAQTIRTCRVKTEADGPPAPAPAPAPEAAPERPPA